MNIAIGGDHAAVKMKAALVGMLESAGYTVQNYGTNSEESVDYPDFAHPVAEAVKTQKAELGIVICGSGNGINMAVNKHEGIRSALCWNVELAQLARQHNNANVLALPARFISLDDAMDITTAFLKSEFEGGRHQRRVNKIDL